MRKHFNADNSRIESCENQSWFAFLMLDFVG